MWRVVLLMVAVEDWTAVVVDVWLIMAWAVRVRKLGCMFWSSGVGVSQVDVW